MIAQLVAFLAVATSVAIASPCGCCYTGYGRYVNAPVVGSGVCGSRILGTGCGVVGSGCVAPCATSACTAPVVGCGCNCGPVLSTPPFRSTVGFPECINSCENSCCGSVNAGLVASPVCCSPGFSYSCGTCCGCGSSFNRCCGSRLLSAC